MTLQRHLELFQARRLERPLTAWRAWDRADPLTSQLRALQLVAIFKTVFVFGGNRSGKTELLRAVLVALLLGSDHPDAAEFWINHGLDPDSFPRGPGHGWIVALRASDSLTYHRKQILALIPKWGPRHPMSEGEGRNWHARGLYGKDEAHLEIMVPGYDRPATIIFKSDDPGPDTMQGDSCRAILHDEESRKHGSKTWEEADVRLWDQEGWHLMSNTPTRGKTWLYQEHVAKRKPETEALAWIHSEDNPHLSPEKLRQLKRGDARTAAIRLRGEFVAQEGRVYPAFSRQLHVVPAFEIPAGSPRFRGIDFGFRHPFVCIWLVVLRREVLLPDGRLLPDGAHVVYREHHRKEWTLSQHVARIRALEGARFVGTHEGDAVADALAGRPVLGRWEGGEGIEATWADPEDLQQRMQLGHTYGIECTKASKAVAAGITVVADALAPGPDGRPTLYVVDVCVETIQELESYCWGEKGDSERPVGQEDHCCDPVRYVEVALRGYFLA